LSKNADGFILAIPKLRVHSSFWVSKGFLQPALKFKEVSSDSALIKITMEITVLQLFDNFALNIT